MNDDLTLLREFAAAHSEAAFAALVTRHVNLVYSVALRQVGDPHLAEEITQAVFIILARKADSLGDRTILPGWLCRTARYVGAQALREQRRRQRREQEAHMQSLLDHGGDAAWQSTHAETWAQLAPLLDRALEALGRKDHDALVLRFFEGKNFVEVGAALGTGEDAARMRVHRAVEKLRKFLTKRGISSTTAIFAETISANSVQVAPAGLAKAVTVLAMAKGASAGTSTLILVKGTIKTMTWLKFKFGIICAATLIGTTAILAVLANHSGQAVPSSRPASLVEIQQIFNLATATKPDRCQFEADIEVTTPSYTTEQVKTALAEIENFMRDANAHLSPQQKSSWEIVQSNAIVKAHSGKRIQHVREWYSGNYYRLDINDEGMGEERFMRAHPNEYFETWVNIPDSPFSPYASYSIQRELHDMVLYKQKGERFHQYNLWQALKMNREVAGLFVASVINPRDTNNLKRPMFNYAGLKMDPSRVQQLQAQTDPSWRLEATDEELDGKPVTHFALKWSFTLPPGIHADFKPDILQGEIWVGQISGKAVCLQELMTNLTQHTSTVVRREKYDGDGIPTVWTTTTLKADSSFEKERVVFKRIETNPSFTDEEAFAPVFPPNYIVSDGSSGRNVILQNPHPNIPIAK